jgi:hypothetical protein
MDLEDKMICEAWMIIGKYPISDAEQNGGFWKRIHDYFHDHKLFG